MKASFQDIARLPPNTSTNEKQGRYMFGDSRLLDESLDLSKAAFHQDVRIHIPTYAYVYTRHKYGCKHMYLYMHQKHVWNSIPMTSHTPQSKQKMKDHNFLSRNMHTYSSAPPPALLSPLTCGACISAVVPLVVPRIPAHTFPSTTHSRQLSPSSADTRPQQSRGTENPHPAAPS